MADVHQLQTVKKAEEEASHWIARLDADDVSAEDRAAVELWRRAHPLNARAFEELSTTWRRFLSAAASAQHARAAGDSGLSGAARSVGAARRRSWVGAALAAAAIVATVSTVAYLHSSQSLPSYSAAVGEQVTIPLSDGSFLELNSNSLVRVDFSSRARIIQLDRGEVFFRVAHDPNRPFWVTAGGGWVRDVGTEFDVYLKAKSIQVTVRQGTVSAGEGAQALGDTRPDEQHLQSWVTLSGGQQADLEAGSARKRALSANELADAVAWRSGTVYFENRPLAEVAAELNRYSAHPLILEDTPLRTLSVGGAFRAGPQGSDALVRMLEQNFDVRVQRDASGIHLRSPPDPSE